jgi:hypothetical protein
MAGPRRVSKRAKSGKKSSKGGAQRALSPRRIEQLLRSSVINARELDRKLKRLFELSEANASLRLK